MLYNWSKRISAKNVHPTALEKILDALVKNGSYFPEWSASKVFMSLSKPTSIKDNFAFTAREKEFLTFTTTEMSYKEIVEKMFCSPRTVESYRDSLFEKLDLKSRVGLAVFAIKNGYCS